LGALKAQLRLACEIYNALRRADIDFHRRNGRGLTLTELRQLALDLRKRSEYYQRLHSQVAQGIADRFYNAKRRFLEGLARFPREKKPHKYYSLTYPQGGWRILSVRDIRAGSRNRKKLIILRLSHLGTFRVIAHRDFPMDKVRRVAVKLAESGRLYVSFLVEDYEFPRLPGTGRAVAIDVGVEKLLVTSDGEYFPNLRPYEEGPREAEEASEGALQEGVPLPQLAQDQSKAGQGARAPGEPEEGYVHEAGEIPGRAL